MNNTPILPTSGYLRLGQIIGTYAASPRKKADVTKLNRKTEAPFYYPLIPVSRSTWFAGIKANRYPKPSKKFGRRISAWAVEDIRLLLEKEE